ncbi:MULTISPECIES: hypothetical protein [Flavobacterium]|uniref:hypothetical protein n=1 Tax=Flavobacterium TaxID=237 RepID=UPI001FE65939|nr:MULTISPECIES: hypothetical protein [Flavobacterium]
MKSGIVIIIFFVLFKPILPVFEYVINYDYITTVLCENKAKPEMACNGKCHLMKELAKSSETEKPLSTDKKNVRAEVEVLFLEIQKNFELAVLPSVGKTQKNFSYSNLYTHLGTNAVFHPPAFIS